LPGSESRHQRHPHENQKHSFHKIFGGPPRCLGLRAKVGYGRLGILLLQDGSIPPEINVFDALSISRGCSDLIKRAARMQGRSYLPKPWART
jgi:hypothetical protein